MEERLSAEHAAMLPALFIVGAPRCGTTSLARALSKHPKIAFSKPKEPHYFTYMLREPFDTEEARAKYLGFFFPSLTRKHQVLAEGSVSTLYDPDAVRRILRCFPNAKFVVNVRNPLEMLPSYHARLLFLLDEDQPDLRKAWELQEERVAGRHIPRDCRDPNLLRYSSVARVGAALEALFETAGRERCHVVVYDDYARDPAAAQREVLRFVGLELEGQADTRRRNPTRAYRSRTLQRLLRRPPQRLIKALPQATVLRARTKKRGLFGRIAQFLRDWNVVTAPRPALDADMRQRLITELSDDVALLSRLTGRDLGHWFRTTGADQSNALGRKAVGA